MIQGHQPRKPDPSIFEWSVTGVKVINDRKAKINLYGPGSDIDQVTVRLYLWDRLKGKTIEEKTKAAVNRLDSKFRARNKERERLKAMGQRIMENRK